MKIVLKDLINRLHENNNYQNSIIKWACPIPSFGDINKSKIATVGLNPSNLEFVDRNGNELVGSHRRFHTLNSLQLNNWENVNDTHLASILNLCKNYFNRNPYDAWFKKLDYLISGNRISYYFPSFNACHLDLVPFATSLKWADIDQIEKTLLLEIAGNSLGLLLRNSPIEIILLNGKAVVENFREISQNQLLETKMPEWTLPRKSGIGVMGYAYDGVIQRVGNIELGKSVRIIGYNHNIQSSFGVSSAVQTSIRNWITKSFKS